MRIAVLLLLAAVSTAAAQMPVQATVSGGGACFLTGTVSERVLQGEKVYVYEYPDEAAAKLAAATVGCTGDTINGCILEWNAYPHFFRKGRVVVMHVGSAAVARTLTAALGPPFAGEGSPCHDALRADAEAARLLIERGEVGSIRGTVTDRRGKRVSLLVVRARGRGWGAIERTGWAPYGAKRQRGEFIMEGVPAGTYELEVSEFREDGVVWTGTVDVVAGTVTTVKPRIP